MSSRRTSRIVPSRTTSLDKSSKNISKAGAAATYILESCLHELGGESASLFLRCDGARDDLTLVEAIGSRRNYHCGKTVGIGEGITGYVVKTKRPLLVENLSALDSLSSRKAGDSFDSFMSCPVIDASSSVVAVIHISGTRGKRPFSSRDLRKFKEISEECRHQIKSLLGSRHTPAGRIPSRRPAWIKEAGKTKGEGLEQYDFSILRSLSKHVVVFDNELKITYSSKEDFLRNLLGWPQAAGIIGKSLLDLPLDIEKPLVTQKLYGLLSNGTPFSLNEIKIKGITRLRIVNMFFSPFVSTDGILKGGLLIIDDDTENYQIRRRLIEAEKFSFIGSLTAMIAHEVNDPLDGVMRLINLSVDHLEKKDRIKEYLGEAQKGLQRIASLVGSLLTFSRKSASLTDELTPLNRIINEAAAIISNRNEGKHVALEFELTDENPIVKTNDFYQALTNLLSNAFDAVPPDGGRVRIKTEISSNELSITVEDNGCGIPDQMKEKVFEPFWTSKKYDKGTGLGLAIVKTIVERYGGSIELESREKKGTRFGLTFGMDKLAALRTNT